MCVGSVRFEVAIEELMLRRIRLARMVEAFLKIILRRWDVKLEMVLGFRTGK
jgi:hypothetical protein